MGEVIACKPARVRIKNLLLRAYIGIKEEEIRNQQDVLINVELTYDATEAITRNEIEAALNYRTITKQIIRHVDGNRFALLERLTHEVLGIVMAHPAVHWARVEIDKPHALRYAESVSVTLEAQRTPD
ncbi:dihydroneopterin triphosphate 2'-epimerase [Marinobacter lutaoensis]|jgi:D-erythro-7,8-dihydroneopterin triphosphate epimerase|uniref:dihydroneopterin triphosphate 2'-epimerase n=1 Tax=Marinobacter lutaoensis TaxID=135739 RepID=UPI000C0A2FE5|nr:dihydroneopterin triphosphate 2'-epimerase [Marinobacter lutaoensis]MBE01953.1 dihydroneopterin triphosphate 2'-epimerase [Marinobacter sp.]MBI43775.1 dihydroneopterin triphosphate 2'-epimerase [Oceanospirillales bacterium]NVD35703.1 dihydroneopterin triphosphate 2'-epimerase [Marinobacter lutaoensis]|tara:strand:- start:1413 stop:1796 length:384 start_codon:yes stop_codon:yes gene_type:complete